MHITNESLSEFLFSFLLLFDKLARFEKNSFMGCGASNNVVNDDTQPVSNAPIPTELRSSQQQKQCAAEQVSFAPKTSTTGNRWQKIIT